MSMMKIRLRHFVRNEHVLLPPNKMLPTNAEKLEKTPILVLIFVYDNNNMHANILNIGDC